MSDAKTFFSEWEAVIKRREPVTEAAGEDPPLPDYDAVPVPAVAVAPCPLCGVQDYGHDAALCEVTLERDAALALLARCRDHVGPVTHEGYQAVGNDMQPVEVPCGDDCLACAIDALVDR